MAPKRKNQGANPRQNLFTRGDLPDKDFNPMAGSEDSQGRENSYHLTRDQQAAI